MEAINYAPSGQNMILTEDAQIVPGVSGNACYLPAGTGTIALAGDRNELSVSLWRQWDGVVESDAPRGVFRFKNIRIFFDNVTDFLTVVINGFKAITDIKDKQEQVHWCFTFVKNDRFIIYKDAKEVYSLPAGDKPVDMADGFSIGGGRTHATFDEVRVYKTVLTQGEINGLFYLVSKGTQVKQLEKIVQSATPKYLGVTETVPATRTAVITKGERLGAQDANAGDWVLMAKTIGGWKCGVCYRWTGTLWINLEPEKDYAEQYHACLLHICEIDELMKETGHFGALFAKQIIAQEAFIKKLAADQAFLKELIVQKLRIDSDKNSNQDFEAWFDKDNGLKIQNNGQVVFSVNPSGFAFMKNAKFEGEIDCQGFKVINTGNTTPTLQFSWSKGNDAFTCASKISAVGSYDSLGGYYYNNPLITKHYGDGIYGGNTIRSIIYKRWRALTLTTGFVCIKLELLNNNGSLIGIISVSRHDNGYIYSSFTENDESKGWAAYRASQYDFAFYTYNPSQTVMIPNISFGKASTPNILYRDENGFVKIS
ncbi:LamG domain-containing protein [Treponema vincentii]|uniref:LamG-like jellyroll fold domain-containing protein n=1 Tax=Treponema vincentii TaxID=69710 RepID=UPI001BB08BC0|nr:LamG-like jellyroll fold domain-containing protein [Treponema vincentii]QUY18389.1 LamG domain-containing protein [Treponema vincentii]